MINRLKSLSVLVCKSLYTLCVENFQSVLHHFPGGKHKNNGRVLNRPGLFILIELFDRQNIKPAYIEQRSFQNITRIRNHD